MEKSSRATEDHPSTSSSSSSSSSSSTVTRRSSSYRAPISSRPSPRSGVVTFFCEPPCEGEPRHYLDACHLCRRPLNRGRDIFMYRGDTPFCSHECRHEQIELDEARAEEDAGYWRSQRRNDHRVGGPAAEVAEVQSIHTPAGETAVAG